MKFAESPLCSSCPIRPRIEAAPEIVFSEPLLQVVGYIEDFVGYRDGFIDNHVGLDADLQQLFGEDYSSSGPACDADDDFVKTAYETKQKIMAYLDMLPADISVATTLELGRCAHLLAAGSCAHTGAIPRYAEKLAEMQADGQVD